MSLGKKLFLGASPACTTDTADIFGDSSGLALYSLDYDASDASGNYDGTPSNVTFGVDGQINYGASFNGTSSKITLPTGSPFNDSNTIKSISGWIKPDALTNRVFLYSHSSSTNASDYFYVGYLGDLNRIYVAVRNGSSANQNNRYADVTLNSNWNHIVAQLNGSTVEIWLNGVQQTVTNNTTGTATNSSWIDYPSYDSAVVASIGVQRAYDPNYSTGLIDQVRIFSKALSATEISTLVGETACVYTSTTDTLNYQGTNLAYYKLDNTAEDETGNYDGTESNITYEFGRFGQAAVFNGTSSSIDIGTISELPSNTNNEVDFTFSAWVKSNTTDLNAGGGSNPIFINQNNSYQYIGFGGNDNGNFPTGRIFYYTFGGSGQHNSWIITDETFDDDNWHHVVVTDVYNSGTNNRTRTLYVDNVQRKQDTVDKNFSAGTVSTYLGSSSNAYSKQYLDQVRIYNSALDAAAVENLYNEKPEADTSNFKTVLYNGTGSNRYVSNVGFQPDLVWVKKRDGVHDHKLADSVRGATKILESSTTDAEITATGSVNSFDSNGFGVGSDSSVNGNGNDFVAWCWKGGGDAVSNTNGDITSQVSANQDAGFSIVEYTGNLSAATTATGESVGHGLSSPPELIIFKNTSNITQWNIFSSELDNWSTRLQFDTSQKSNLYSQYPIADPTSSVFYTNYLSSQNVSGSTHIAYCFHSVTGYQKIGSYTGGGSSGKTVTTGFRPRWVMIRRTDIGNYWVIIDSVRDTSDPYGKILWANVPDQEADGGATTSISFTNTGFSMSTSAVGSSINASGGTYIYLAIA